jgi:hypothetical protein
VQQFVAASDQNLGHLEVEVQRQTQELQRRAVEAGAQAKADAILPCCPVCHQPVSRLTEGHERTFRTRFGPVTLRRTRGWCRRCKNWRFPADAVLGLEDSAGASPAVQELAALLASKMPMEELLGALEEGSVARETVAREVAYLREHQGSDGLSRRPTPEGTAGQRGGGGDLGAVSVPVQAHGTVLESGRGRSAIVFGHLLAQRALASALPQTSQPVQKLKCPAAGLGPPGCLTPCGEVQLYSFRT